MQTVVTTHTPGPWRIAPSSAYRDGGLNIDAGPSGQDGYICLAGMPDEPQAVANARLIAAAPDMLDALKAVRPLLMSLNGGHPAAKAEETMRDQIAMAVFAVMDLALAKAEGR